MISIWTILVVILILVLLGMFPRGPWYGPNGASWGYGPMGGVGVILLILILFLLFQRGYP